MLRMSLLAMDVVRMGASRMQKLRTKLRALVVKPPVRSIGLRSQQKLNNSLRFSEIQTFRRRELGGGPMLRDPGICDKASNLM